MKWQSNKPFSVFYIFALNMETLSKGLDAFVTDTLYLKAMISLWNVILTAHLKWMCNPSTQWMNTQSNSSLKSLNNLRSFLSDVSVWVLSEWYESASLSFHVYKFDKRVPYYYIFVPVPELDWRCYMRNVTSTNPDWLSLILYS